MARRAHDGRARRPRVAGRGRRRAGARGRGIDALAVQLLPHLLASGALPRAVVGDVLDVAPVIYAASVEPARGSDRWLDGWAQDEFGALEAVGSTLAARLDPVGCSCRVDVLDVAGSLVPLNPAAALLDDAADRGAPADEALGPAAPRVAGPGDDGERIRVRGALYLDPELGPGTPHGSAVALCRRRYRVAAVRRYRRTAGVPVDPVRLPTAPGPGTLDEEGLYVAELVALDAAPTP